ncbi:hypothetical protein BN1058_02359 [Paraliobacillus sp. PM-2]|uniref:DUF7305 domain-containing protein n=1 Tax=Paraliobacillus sp. PM-2 TaxID=1462524 RepID=UPI00061C64EB|nr:PilX N-terminal domain-containing pilus assembly protein [Paraliobacillus sp. PM-2]CQR48019.1 hypothetical protein BN1058_02359 [Paraliobacillus sp. PM-2]
MDRVWKNESGASLVLVLLTLTVLTMLGTAIATVSYAHLKLTTKDRDYQSTYYIAEAGVHQTYAKINSIVSSVYSMTSSEAEFYAVLNSKIDPLNDKVLTNFSKHFGENPIAEIEVKQLTDGNPREYQIISKGTIGNQVRTVSRPFRINWQSDNGIAIPEQAVAVIKSTISLKGGAWIEGDIYIASSNAKTIQMSGGTKITNGIAYVPKESVDNALDLPKHFGGDPPTVKENHYAIPWADYRTIVDSFPIIPAYTLAEDETIGGSFNRFDVIKNGNLNINSWQADNYTFDLNRDTSFKNITLKSNNKLNIDTNDQDHNIVVDNLNINNGVIELKGSGKVNIYVKNNFKIGAGSTLNQNASTEQLNIFLAGKNQKVKISGGQSINGSLFAQDADVTLSGGGRFNGYMVTGGNKVTFNGGVFSKLFLLAPDATVDAGGGVSISGAIISKEFNGGGGAKVDYQAVDLGDFPFSTENSSLDDLITKEPPREIH